jgi:hypothetical protein
VKAGYGFLMLKDHDTKRGKDKPICFLTELPKVSQDNISVFYTKRQKAAPRTGAAFFAEDRY